MDQALTGIIFFTIIASGNTQSNFPCQRVEDSQTLVEICSYTIANILNFLKLSDKSFLVIF